MMNKLIEQIDRFLKENQMKPSTFGHKAVNDGKFVARIRKGGRVWPETEKKVLDFIATYKDEAA